MAQCVYALAADLGLLELVPAVLRVPLLQRLHGRHHQLQGLVGLLGLVDQEAGILVLLGPVVHGPTATCLCG